MREVLRRHREPEAEHALVATLRRVDTLAEAIADCSWVVGTTMRTIEGRPRFTPRELAAESVRRHDSTWALVFGAESNGLRNAEVDQCHAVSFIPSADEQPSLNLSQAVVVYAHELSTVRTGGATPGQPALADDATLRAVEHELIGALVAGGYLHDAKAGRRVIAALMSSLSRGSLTADEAASWRQLLAQRF
jgi:tRNA/rRNA methyltransferase/tRNA (cytidine32/uridine32-2'-O)-methyltransferase